MGTKVVYHKKSVVLVTGTFLLRVVALLGSLSSEATGLIQSRLITHVVFEQLLSKSLRLIGVAGSAFQSYYNGVHAL